MSEIPSEQLPIEVRQSTIHGHGAFAARALKRGEAIGRYTGRRYAPDEIDSRDWDTAVTFVFGLSDGSVIDGMEGGNATRHINHSCAPNCTAFEVEDEQGRPAIVIEALRPIKAGEELFLDYGLDAGSGEPEDFVCRCGAKACRGSMLAPTAAAGR